MAKKEDNLRPCEYKLSQEEAKRGGIRSGEVRRRRKTLREELLLLLSQGNVQERISVAVIDKCLAGDIRAFETLRDTIGEKPKEEIDANLGIKTIKVELKDN